MSRRAYAVVADRDKQRAGDLDAHAAQRDELGRSRLYELHELLVELVHVLVQGIGAEAAHGPGTTGQR